MTPHKKKDLATNSQVCDYGFRLNHIIIGIMLIILSSCIILVLLSHYRPLNVPEEKQQKQETAYYETMTAESHVSTILNET